MQGLPHPRRLVQPYCHGVSNKGTAVLRAIQVGGSSSSGGYGFGKLWNVEEILNPRMTGQSFAPNDPHYNPDDSGMRVVHCRIQR